MVSLPDNVTERIKLINSRTQINIDEIERDYNEIFNDPFIQEDTQFQSDEERHRYAVMVLWTRYVARPPVQEFTLVPIGIGGMRLARSSGKPNCEIYVLIKGQNKIKRIACRGPLSDLYRNVNLFDQYTVKLGEFQKGGDLIADNRTKFEKPKRLKLKPAELMSKIGVKKISVAAASKFPSAQRSDGYLDRGDWRCVQGIIIREYRGTRDDETQFGVYTIADETLNGEPTVADDGTVLLPGFTVWVDPSLMVYQTEDEVACYGTVSVTREGEAQMNAYSILPIHTREREE